MKGRQSSFVFIKLLVIQSVAALSVARDFDFFYFVQQWPASYCDTKRSCCYPTTGKPAEDFSIHGLWPNYDDGTYPSNCDSDNLFDQSEISDLTERLQKEWPTLACPSGDGYKFWQHEWDKHGTCSENVLNQHSYFQKALDLKSKANLLEALSRSGIRPNGKYYSLDSIKEAIQGALRVSPYIECNVDPSGNHQLYQVYLCVDSSATDFMECPVMPHGRRCGSKIEFPSFSDSDSIGEDYVEEL
ncbi:intracellular ribonuclease LX-like [Diospyros lotus]|uniref:intracellular ribonuclease LX-like n=1 Tax=Diospyros lotus TaxID=55363 RepID=UPI00225927B4|nr:intracellular ribonuclease LX-like [Diospyros lotus]